MKKTIVLKIKNKKLTFKNNAPFRSFISKINNILIGNAENLNIVMSMYNLLEYSDKYFVTTGRLWNYYRDEINDSTIEYNDDGNKINSSETMKSKYFR